MKTDALIQVLAADSGPVAAGAAQRRVLGACLVGGLATAVLIFAILHPHDLAGAARTASFWMKAAFTVGLAVGGWLLTEQAARPGAAGGRGAYIIASAMLGMVIAALASLAQMPPNLWRAAWIGGSASFCPFAILASAAPVFVAVTLTLRSLAPTRLRAAGAAAGLLAGGLGAALYALWCRETSPVFVACWYSLGVAGCAALGGLLGPKVLRW